MPVFKQIEIVTARGGQTWFLIGLDESGRQLWRGDVREEGHGQYSVAWALINERDESDGRGRIGS